MPDRWDEAAARLAAEHLITTTEAARLVPSSRGKTAAWTITRWIQVGKCGVFLDGIRASGKGWHTSREALTRFWAALSRAGREETNGKFADRRGPSRTELLEQIKEAELTEAKRVLGRAGKGARRKQ